MANQDNGSSNTATPAESKPDEETIFKHYVNGLNFAQLAEKFKLEVASVKETVERMQRKS